MGVWRASSGAPPWARACGCRRRRAGCGRCVWSRPGVRPSALRRTGPGCASKPPSPFKPPPGARAHAMYSSRREWPSRLCRRPDGAACASSLCAGRLRRLSLPRQPGAGARRSCISKLHVQPPWRCRQRPGRGVRASVPCSCARTERRPCGRPLSGWPRLASKRRHVATSRALILAPRPPPSRGSLPPNVDACVSAHYGAPSMRPSCSKRRRGALRP